MNSPRKTVYHQLLPGVVLGICILFGLMILGDANKVSLQFLHFKWGFFALAVGFSLVNYAFRFLKRHFCLNLGGRRTVSLKNSIQLYAAGVPLSVTSMKIGEAFKGIWLNRVTGLPVEKAITLFLVDHISDGLSIFLLLIFGTISFPDLWPFFLLVFILFLTGVFFLQIKPWAQGLLHASDKIPFLEGILPQLAKCMDGSPELLGFWAMLFSSLLGLISWLADGAALVSILIGLGFSFSWYLVGVCILVFAFSTLMGIISAFPAGVGVFEAAMATLLTLFLSFRPEIAAAATILFRLATFWLGFLVGLLIWYFCGKTLGIQGNEGHIVES